MAQKQKRPSPLDEPPTASSSDSEEEDQHPSSQQHGEEEEEEDDDEEASSEEQEEDDDEEEDQPPSKNPPPPPTNPHPKPPSSESDTETDSESDSEPDPHAPSAANSKVKPLASKPMEQTPKAKPQPSASATATARSASSKRPADNNGHVSDPKRVKKKGSDSAAAASDDEAEEDAKKSGDDSKKLFQRLWSEEDEIAILKGLAEFTSKTGSDPLKHANAFHDFMKKSLHADASSNQLKQKIRRLKKKFETNAGKGKNGEGPTFSKAHDQKSFEFSKKVWGNAEVGGGAANGGVEKAKSNGKAAKSPKKEGNSRNVAPPKQKPKPKPEPKSELTSMDSKEAGKMDIDEKIDTMSHVMEVIRLGKGVGLSGLNEDVVKRGVELIGASKRAELEEQWKELQVAELELYVKRAELVANQARLILEAYKSSNS